MLKSSVVAVCFLVASVATAQQPGNSEFIYFSVESSSHQKKSAPAFATHLTAASIDKYYVSNAGFDRYMPAIGIGYQARATLLFVQLNLSYRYADKQVAVHSDHFSSHLHENILSSAHIVEDLQGFLMFHYINSDLKLGMNLNKFLTLSLGLRRSFVSGWTFEGSYEKTVVSTDTYLKTNRTFERYFFGKYHNRTAIAESRQSIEGQNFALISLTAFCHFGGRPGFVDFCGQIPFQSMNDSYFLNLTLGIYPFKLRSDRLVSQP